MQARGLLRTMRGFLLIGLYVAASIAFVIAVNADPENFTALLLVTLAAALVVGWGTGAAGWQGLWLWVLLPWVLVPLGLPFGETNQPFNGGDDLYPVAFVAVFAALPSVVAMLIGAGSRNLYGRLRRHASD